MTWAMRPQPMTPTRSRLLMKPTLQVRRPESGTFQEGIRKLSRVSTATRALPPGRRRGSPDHELDVEGLPLRRAFQLTLHPRIEHRDGDARELGLRLAHRRQANTSETGHDDIVEADHRQVFRHPDAQAIGAFQQLDGAVVVGREHGGDATAQDLADLLVALLAQQLAGLPLPVEDGRLQPRTFHHAAVALLPIVVCGVLHDWIWEVGD